MANQSITPNSQQGATPEDVSGSPSPKASVADLCRKRREANLLCELTDFAPVEERREQAGDAYARQAAGFEKEACRTPIRSAEDLRAALNLMEEFRKGECCGNYVDDRDGALLENIGDYARDLIEERERTAEPNPFRPVLEAGEALDILHNLRAIVRGLAVSVRALGGGKPSGDELAGAVEILRCELERASKLDGRFLDAVNPNKVGSQ